MRIFADLIQSVYNGAESTSYLGRKIWEQVTAENKIKEPFDGFKREIKQWKHVECPWRICRMFVPNLGFI